MIFNASWPNQLKAKAEQKKLTTEPYNESLDKFLIRMLMSPKLFLWQLSRRIVKIESAEKERLLIEKKASRKPFFMANHSSFFSYK